MAATAFAAPAPNDDNHRALSATKPSLLPHANCPSMDNCDYHPKGLREPIKGAVVHTTMVTVARNVAATLTVKPDVTSDVPRPTIKKGTAVEDLIGRPLSTSLAKRMKGVVTIGEAIDMDENEKVKHVWKPWLVPKGSVGKRELEEKKKKKEGGVFWRARAAFKGLWI
ncbi:MAG: hypothetical protein Q9215_000518 [Flavoplaca cf. flavocitrina]